MSGYETLRFDRQGAVGTLTLDRPATLNAVNLTMCEELADLAGVLAHESELRCLVVTGAGDTFSSGLDLTDGLAGTLESWAARPVDELEELGLTLAGAFEWLPALPIPSVAAVRGHAYGAGLQLALACDFRVFAESTRAGLVENRFGLLPDMGATFRLPRLVGEGRARELILLGEVVDGAEAARCGLADRVVPDAGLDDAVSALAERLAAQPPLAVQGARRAIAAGWDNPPDVSLRRAVAEQARCLTSEDFREALSAFAERRPPRWTGR